MKKAIISGVTGQDGFFLKKFLKKKNYSVLGLSRKNNRDKKIIKTDYSIKSLKKIINSFNPDEIYNLTGFTKPSESWDYPEENFFANLNITLNFLEIIKKKSNIKFFNASSSEIFGETGKELDENSKIFPKNPYGISKSASYFLVDAYRSKYDLFLVNAILFNHESFMRDDTFLFKYLFNSCLDIKKDKIKKIKLKDSRPVRDFGCAKDFVSYFHKLMQIKKSGNFVVATGKSYSVKQIANIYKKKFNLSKDVIEFKNNFDFNNLHKIKKANNKKLIRTLKLSKIKKAPEVIANLIKDLSR